MPAKGSKLKYGHRNHIFGIAFWKRLIEGKKLELNYGQSRSIITRANEIIGNIILEEIDGFKLPYGLGYLVATKFIPKNPAIDWKKSKELGTTVYFTNLHTFGYSVRVSWYSFIHDCNRSNSFRNIYMFKTAESLSKRVAKKFAAGKDYLCWVPADFVNKGMLEKLFRKRIENSKNIVDGSY